MTCLLDNEADKGISCNLRVTIVRFVRYPNENNHVLLDSFLQRASVECVKIRHTFNQSEEDKVTSEAIRIAVERTLHMKVRKLTDRPFVGRRNENDHRIFRL